MRHTHFLKLNECNEIPKHILLVDTEARIERLSDGTQKQTLRLGCAIYISYQKGKWSEKEFTFYTRKEFYDIMNSLLIEKTRLYIFAHNMSYDYTILGMDSYLSENNFEIGLRVIGGENQPFIISARRNGITLMILSTTNYYSQALKKLGKIFGMEKGEIEDFENVSDKELLPYCINDTKIITKLIREHIQFIRDKDLGNFKITIAGQALNAFRHRFLYHKLLIHTFQEILDMEIASFHGGRCEAFFIGKKENVYKLDVNSMYPFVMRNNPFPTSPIWKEPRDNIPLEKIIQYIEDNKYVLAKCLIEIKEPFIPLKEEKLIFPIGKFECILTHPEIKFILDNPQLGKIIEFQKVVLYEQEYIFSSYVDFFYKIRSEAPNDAIKEMAKIFLNGLYGKFAQKGGSDCILETNEADIKIYKKEMEENNTNVIDDLDIKGKRYVMLGENVYRIEPSKEALASESMPIISATVTAYARLYLFQLMQIANRKEVFYCDTDSLFVSKTGYEKLLEANQIHPTELGKLKLEEIGSCEIYGAKNYKFNDKIKLKGIKKNAEKIDENTYRQLQFETKNIRYRKGTNDGIVMLTPIIKKISKEYDKGILHKDGTIEPLTRYI